MRFSNETLACIAKTLASLDTDTSLRNLFFRYNLVPVYEQSGSLTAKLRKVMDVFNYLCKQRDADDVVAVKTLNSIVEGCIKDIYSTKKSHKGEYAYPQFVRDFPDLSAALRADGYQVQDGRLIPTISTVIDAASEEGLVERLLDKYHLSVARNHLKQAFDDYIDGRWEASNASLRTFLQSVFDEIASIIAPKEAVTKAGGQRRKLLQEKGFIQDGTEANLVQSFFSFANEDGSHPGISDESDCRLRRYMAVAIAAYYLIKLEENHA